MRWLVTAAWIGVLGMMVTSVGGAGLGAHGLGPATTTGTGVPAVICCGGGGGGGGSNGTYEVILFEDGLPSGTNWTLTFDGTNHATTSTAFEFWEKNGSFNYSAEVLPGYATTPASGEVLVDGGSVIQLITYLATGYEVTFSETGLPSGTAWWVSLDGGAAVESTSASLMIPAADGNHTYQVYAPEDYPTAVYSAGTTAGSVNVDGAPVAAPSIKFTSLIWSITFTESGLPKGTGWSVNLSEEGTGWNSTESSSGSQISYAGLFNAEYCYVINGVAGYVSSPTTGCLELSGASQKVPVTFQASGGEKIVGGPGSAPGVAAREPAGTTGIRPEMECCGGGGPPDYPVTFEEVGLPNGTTWSVNLSGWDIGGNASSLEFFEPNGTYNFTVQQLANFTSQPVAGQLTVDGSSATVGVPYLPALYEVTIPESGLPSGTAWWVEAGTAPWVESTASSLMVPSASGTNVSYHVLGPSEWPSTVYKPGPQNGWVETSAQPTTVSTVKFVSQVWEITFAETGLPKGGTWSVSLNNTTWSLKSESSGSSIVFAGLYNATYSYTVHPPSGYSASPTTGRLVLSGASQKVSVKLES